MDRQRAARRSQAANGLRRWAESFAHVTLAAPVIPEHLAAHDRAHRWVPQPELNATRISLVDLPWAYRIDDFLRTYSATRRVLRELIQTHEFLQLGIGGLIGDWAAVAAGQATKLGRAFAVHTDRVEHEVLTRSTHANSPRERLKAAVVAPLMKALHYRILRRCDLALLHGHDCMNGYARLCRMPKLVHDVHTAESDRITPAALQAKLATVRAGEPLQLVYAGRAAAMKAPLDWLRAVARVRDAGVPVRAAWLGDGPLRPEMQQLCAALGLARIVDLPGFVDDRQRLLQALRAAHVMPFAHITPESPRCLIESLISGTPIVGYTNEYARDLVNPHGGGTFVPVHDWQRLGDVLVELANDRERLAGLIASAARSGERFSDVAVFRERSDLIREHLRRPPWAARMDASRGQATSHATEPDHLSPRVHAPAE